MANATADGSESREQLSALADGELSGEAVRRACALWRDDAGQRATWHAYQLIGDVMRSEDLACDASRDRAFLGALRERLAVEPVVLAPAKAEPVALPGLAAMGSGRSVWRSWRAPAAVAAGFVAVAGVLVVMRGTGALPGAEAGPPLAQAVSPATAVQPTAVQQVAATVAPLPAAPESPQSVVASGQLIRDAQLDRYLAAHKQFAGSSALGVPSSFLRSATANAANR